MDVSIIIVNYKTIGLIVDCIRSIKERTMGVDYEIIVVDNNSEDSFEEIIRQHFPDDDAIRCVPLQENIGFGQANNRGLMVAAGRNVLCLNPDTILINNAIKILNDYMDEHDDVCACGGNLLDADMQPTFSFRRTLPGMWWELNVLMFNRPDMMVYGRNRIYNHSQQPLKVGYVTGADMMVRRTEMEAVGGFSADYFMYYEETDLCRRLINHTGKCIMSVPDAEIQHLEGKSFQSSIDARRIEFSERGRLTYYRKYFSHLNVVLLNAIYRLSLIINQYAFKMQNNPCWLKYKQQRIALRGLLKKG